MNHSDSALLLISTHYLTHPYLSIQQQFPQNCFRLILRFQNNLTVPGVPVEISLNKDKKFDTRFKAKHPIKRVNDVNF